MAYASGSLIDPNILGALCEGELIRPGEPCRGGLAHFLNDLAARQTDWSNDEVCFVCRTPTNDSLPASISRGIYQLEIHPREATLLTIS